MTFFQPKLILVPTDFSEPAAHALRYASALAERVGAHLFVIWADSLVRPDEICHAARAIQLARQVRALRIPQSLRRIARAWAVTGDLLAADPLCGYQPQAVEAPE